MTKASERRDGPRIDLRLRVRYSVVGTPIEGVAEASDISPKGLRIESESQVAKGAELKLSVDAGETETLEAKGRISWVKTRKSPTGKEMFDLGIAFDSDWLDGDRGPLANALARIFAMNSYEPARHMERTKVSLVADSNDLVLAVSDLSVGGMQLRAEEGNIPFELKTNSPLSIKVETDDTFELDARVAWTAKHEENDDIEAFGVQFLKLEKDHKTLIDDIRLGKVHPKKVTVFVKAL